MVATFSLHSVVNSVGAWCGLAALIGLALLVLLYFAQARELRRLSDWVDGEEQRRRLAPGPVTRATLIPQGTAPLPQGAPQPQMTGVVTTAVPGVRRVAVSDAGIFPGPAGVMAPATAAAAAAVQAPAPQAPERANGDGPPEGAAAPPPAAQTRIVAIPVAAPDLPAEAFADPPPATAPAAPAGGAPPSAVALGVGGEARAADAGEFGAHARDPGAADVPAGGPAALAPAQPPATPAAGEEQAGREIPAQAAVPLVARRIPIAELRDAMPAGIDASAASPLDLLRADPPLVEQPAPEGPAAAPPLRPSTAAGARPRFPPAPPVRVQRLRDDDVTIRAPGRAAPDADRTERRPRRELDEDFDEEPPRTFASTLRLLGAAVVIVAILIIVATRLFSSPSTPTTTPPAQSTTSSSQSTTVRTPVVVPGHITVAVLNGTTTAHLASSAWTRLAERGFVKGAIANAPSQNVATSTVGYTHRHRPAARAIATALGFSASAVGPVDATALAQAERNGRRPQVVVTLGADYSRR
jgi:LytR cell envelope-related transcriptional attenuator